MNTSVEYPTSCKVTRRDGRRECNVLNIIIELAEAGFLLGKTLLLGPCGSIVVQIVGYKNCTNHNIADSVEEIASLSLSVIAGCG